MHPSTHKDHGWSPDNRLRRPLLIGLTIVVTGLVAVMVLCYCTGCAAFRLPGFPHSAGPAKPAPDAIADFARTLSHIARWLAVAAVVALAASFAPVVGPFLAPTRRTAVIGFGLSFAVAMCGWLFAAFAKPLAIIVLVAAVVAGGFVAWPYARALVHGSHHVRKKVAAKVKARRRKVVGT